MSELKERSYFTPNDPEFMGSDDAESIQNAVDKASELGVNQVLIPRMNARTNEPAWYISRTILLPSNMTIKLDNCYMEQSHSAYCQMFTNTLAHEKEGRLPENEQHDIVISGIGNVILSGGKPNGLLERTSGRNGLPSIWKNHIIYFHNTRNIVIENIRIRDQRWWGICFLFCSHCRLSNIDISVIPHVGNQDGIDLRRGCNNFIIENITGRSGDDLIALTNISNAYETICAVEGRDPDTHDIVIRNVKGDSNYCFMLRLLNHDGNKMYNISVDGLYDVSKPESKQRPGAAVCIGSHLYWSERPGELGETRNISFNNISSRGEAAVLISNNLSDSYFSNIKTFGDNCDIIKTIGARADLKNVVFDGLFSNTDQVDMIDDTPYAEPAGSILNFECATSGENIVVKNVFANNLGVGFHLGKDVKVAAENINIETLGTMLVKHEGSSLILDGKEV